MPRMIPLLALVAFLIGASVGCGKKPDPEPDDNAQVQPAPENGTPGPTPKPRPTPRPRPKPGPSGKQPDTIYGAYNIYNDKNQLRKMYFGLLAYVEIHKQYPAGIVGPNGDLGLSWRVAILPYLDDEEGPKLYQQFKLNEPWDSDHNKKLLTKMPALFATPGTAARDGRTYYRTFAGPNAFIPLPERALKDMSAHWGGQPGQLARGRTRKSITDGEHDTFAIVQASEPVEWTKPEYLTFTGSTFPELGLHKRDFLGLMCDGTVHLFSEKTTEASMRALATVNAGDFPGPEVHMFGLKRPKK